MTQVGNISAVEILIAIVSVANICLLVTSAFYRRRKTTWEIDLRERVGWVAAFFGLSSQLFYLLMMGSLTLGLLSFDGDSFFRQIHVRFPDVGFLLSAATFFAAWFGRGMRRYASLWVAVTTGFLWMLAGFAYLFSPM